MTENNRFILCNKTTDSNVWDTLEKQCYGWEYVVSLLNGFDGTIKDLSDDYEQLLKENKELKQDLKQIQDSLWTTEHIRKLEKENEQLKDKYNEQSVQYEGLEEQVERLLDFKDNVFNLINTKIKHYEHKPFSAPVGQPMSVNFDADVDRIARLSELQDLKKELKE